ncbi:MAG: hypothetical protein ACKPBA_12170, partial [Planctomycetota bacterium]
MVGWIGPVKARNHLPAAFRRSQGNPDNVPGTKRLITTGRPRLLAGLGSHGRQQAGGLGGGIER